jgi:hypothetical protein
MTVQDWARISAIAAIASAVCTFLAPLFALRISAILADRKGLYERKFAVFQTLMQWRMATYAEQPVHAFNVIDVLFHDVKPVRDAWERLYSAYNDPHLSTPEGARIRKERLNALLWEMAQHLGYGKQFSPDDFARVYNPTVLSRFYDNQIAQTNATYESLQKQVPPPESTK